MKLYIRTIKKLIPNTFEKSALTLLTPERFLPEHEKLKTAHTTKKPQTLG